MRFYTSLKGPTNQFMRFGSFGGSDWVVWDKQYTSSSGLMRKGSRGAVKRIKRFVTTGTLVGQVTHVANPLRTEGFIKALRSGKWSVIGLW